MAELRELASGLEFPEGPIAMPDGSVVLVEIKRGTLTRVGSDGSVRIVARTGGGPNGAAIGPDGKVYVCNNGGFEWHDFGGLTVPGNQPKDYIGGGRHRAHPAGRPRPRAGRGSLHRLRRPAAPRPERHRLRRRGWILVHRPRQDPRSRQGPHRSLLREDRRLAHPRGDLPARRTERRRPLA